ncbi:hypothetical protein M758_1G234100 [Ceratodon purpureus]|nr:hypothetical protein M758_1G234100 [Ceratodon purpureus]KAG0631183.1 hypothetical protein M758_1G234100 [Ceratodon purpureus]KAG0631184.1 hypothetical protein M758_1G234100 [Ceratodon purpureus]KAG0631185.1 hypothetical protein M758_1G234100 [Ceratodon purpureus]KAG0631186.1 hypothetical protein M758_1G234100 [Ceratodon purpureus]
MTTLFTFEDAQRHKEKGDCWLIIDGKVYDVSKFADEHPGGDQVLFASTGKDATEDFEDIGHSAGALELMTQFAIGDIDVTTLPVKHDVRVTPVVVKSPSDMLITALQFLIPLTILALALAVRFLTNDPKNAAPS